MTETAAKLEQLKKIIAECGSALIAYSGGVDSTLLAKVAHDVLQDKAFMVTAVSVTYPDSEIDEALSLAKNLNFQHIFIKTDELSDERFCANPPERCYYCKSGLFGKLKEIAREYNLDCIFDGANYDDQLDFRPGSRAAQEMGVRSPLREVGLTKAELRILSKEYGLPTWNKPSFACLSTRIPYGDRITEQKLKMIGEAEQYLKELGFTQIRVRQHDQMARIEVNPAQIASVIIHASEINDRLKSLGYTYVTVDLQGYRTGSMNDVLPEQA